MKLTKVERWILSNQFEILKALYPDEKSTYESIQEAIEHGYETEWEWYTEHIYDQTMTPAQCIEVINILDMFSHIKFAFDALTDKSGITANLTKFGGFDGNTETEYLAYARFLIEKRDKFTELANSGNLNSHHPTLNRYRNMLREWKLSENEYEMTKADLIRITSV